MPGIRAIRRDLRKATISRNYAISRRAWHGACLMRCSTDAAPNAPIRGETREPRHDVVHLRIGTPYFRMLEWRGPARVPHDRQPGEHRLRPSGQIQAMSSEHTMRPIAKEVLAAARQRGISDGLPYFGAVLPTEAGALLESLPNARLIDVRTRAEWDYV